MEEHLHRPVGPGIAIGMGQRQEAAVGGQEAEVNSPGVHPDALRGGGDLGGTYLQALLDLLE